MVTRELLNKVRGYIDTGVKEGAKLVVDGRGFKLQGYENGNFIGGCLFDDVTPYDAYLQGRDFRPGALRGARQGLRGGGAASLRTRIRQRRRDLHARRRYRARLHSRVQVGMVGVNFAIPVPLAYYTFGGWKRSGFGDLNQHGRTHPLLHQDQDGDGALALGHQGRCRIRYPDHAITGGAVERRPCQRRAFELCCRCWGHGSHCRGIEVSECSRPAHPNANKSHAAPRGGRPFARALPLALVLAGVMLAGCTNTERFSNPPPETAAAPPPPPAPPPPQPPPFDIAGKGGSPPRAVEPA